MSNIDRVLSLLLRTRLFGRGLDILLFVALTIVAHMALLNGVIRETLFYSVLAGLAGALCILLISGRAPGSKTSAVRRALLTLAAGVIVGIAAVLNVSDQPQLGFGDQYFSPDATLAVYLALTSFMPSVVLASGILRGLSMVESHR